jgi:hypothetical protein
VNHLGRMPEPSTDLWAELEHRRSGEGSHVTIEHQRERHRCQGHNLDGDLDAVDTAPERQAACTPRPSVRSGGGCMALALHLCIVIWPHKF